MRYDSIFDLRLHVEWLDAVSGGVEHLLPFGGLLVFCQEVRIFFFIRANLVPMPLSFDLLVI